ncbi:hypothetical protein [Clostridium oryzae]|uniref:XkdX family protein n=1 Tax=Clostridium oryzae TaxID=1450648 RepID=A0A1V4IEJ2_9CLOT|nr:hypothetical protein [Clostridium oryzae]OPJ58428.1 hypothetical protein CLORY_35780 [Clostridium oryzae]
MRMYIVRFWKRMLTMGKTTADIDLLLSSEIITQEEHDAIVSTK